MTTPTAFAFLDFDDTLARGDSILPYLLFCIRCGLAPKRQLFRAAIGFLRWKLNPNCASASKETSLSFIAGKTVEEMDEVARAFFREDHAKRCFAEGVRELERLRESGVTPVIVSASADVYMRVLPEFLPVEAVLSTVCEVKEGRYTGHVGENCKGDEKPRRIAEWLAARGLSVDREASSGYGDSPSDAPMLLMTASPTLVNPKKKLIARVPNGRIVRWQ